MTYNTLQMHNRYGLDIQENVNDTFTIRNNSGDTFVAQFVSDSDIVLKHWNWKSKQGHMHTQGRFNSPESMLRDVFQHGNRLMKPVKQTRMDRLFAQIARA